MSSKCLYTDEKNAQIVLALLKSFGIRRVVANPGTTNIAITGSIQSDPFFQVYSGVDERHSAYLACGMAAQSGEPVVLSCTGATASRNYLPALTEAYYRKLPVLALTSMQPFQRIGNLSPQALDRSMPPADAVRYSISCRTVESPRDWEECVLKVNRALIELTRHGGGPVHLNLESSLCVTFATDCLPVLRRIAYFSLNDLNLRPTIPEGCRIVCFVGSGRIKDHALDDFVNAHNAVVLVSGGASYCGDKVVSPALLCNQRITGNPQYVALRPQLIIDFGEVTGDYATLGYLQGGAPVWRVSEDGEIRDRFGRLECVFEMSVENFVSAYSAHDIGLDAFYLGWENADSKMRQNIPDLPFSNPWIAQNMTEHLPLGARLHLGILNSLRSWDYFLNRSEVRVSANVGGFGIDGCLSTLIGASLVEPMQLFFAVLGDLAFFYDLNSLCNRHVGKNLRILLINNGCGGEFNFHFHTGAQFGERVNDYIAAGGHNGRKSGELVRHYVTDLGFKYLTARTKEEFLAVRSEFVDPRISQSIVLECFTDVGEEDAALRLLEELDHSFAAILKRSMPKSIKSAVKKVIS